MLQVKSQRVLIALAHLRVCFDNKDLLLTKALTSHGTAFDCH
jgi:hypothetical protein